MRMGMLVRESLFELKEKEYADFQSRLVPNISREHFIGVRIPKIRSLAKKYLKEIDELDMVFLKQLPHLYYDENIFHSIVLSEYSEYDGCIELVKEFLPFIDNWAVCDALSPKTFAAHKHEWNEDLCQWLNSEDVYTCRFGVRMLMNHYLGEDFDVSYLEAVAKIKSEDYYVKMAIAWFLSMALVKRWNETSRYLRKNTLGKWTHNKTIQKARESYQLKKEQKEYLLTLKRQ